MNQDELAAVIPLYPNQTAHITSKHVAAVALVSFTQSFINWLADFYVQFKIRYDIINLQLEKP